MNMNLKSFYVYLISITCLVQSILLAYYFKYDSNFNKEPDHQQIDNNFESKEKLITLFQEICEKSGTDKVYHRYYIMYGTYLGPIRHKPLNFLEIGLGCTMDYGPGKALLAWRDYLTHPTTNISYLEYDQKCAEEFLPPKVHKMFIGNQADFELLERVGKEGGPYDFIVDDGGHKRTHQVNSFLGLWPYVKPNGGIYVIEDLYFTFWKEHNDSPYSGLDMIQELVMLFNEATLKGDHMEPTNQTFDPKVLDISKSILSITCYFRACLFLKA